MSETLKLPTCGKCGAALSGYAPDGLCAACLLDSAFEEHDVQFGDPAKPAGIFAFKDYELLEEIARGGMGVVYRARQISLNRPVAIKMILGGHLANADEMQRFRIEAETAAQLQHPNIVAIHEVGEHAGQPFFSMDFIAGRSLAQLVHDGPLPARKAATYLKTIAEAVQYAHSCSVLHRDLKPSNILIDDADQPRVTDFGLAKRLTSTQDSGLQTQDLTQTGQVLGSPSFIPPEQAAGQRDKIGPASDVYSLGAMLYHCLTARPPFMAETLTQTLRMVAENDAVSPRLLNASVPRDLETICLKCLEKAPQRRYATAQELAEELGRFLRDEPIHARPIGSTARMGRWCRRKPALAAVIFLVLVVAIGSPIAAFHINRERLRAEENEKKAQKEAAKSLAAFRFMVSMLQGVGPSVARGRDAQMLMEILDDTAKRVGTDLKDQPEAEADLRIVLGKTYAQLGLVTNALEMTQKAVDLRRTYLGPENAPLAEALNNLGVMLYNAGDLEGAERVDRQTLAMRLKVLDKLHPNVALSYNNLGVALWDQGKFAGAEQMHLRALEIRKKIFPADHLQVGMSLVNLANARATRGDFVRMESDYVAALELFTKQLGTNDPDVAMLKNNLAVYLAKKGELEAAKAIHEKNLELRRNLYKGDHSYVANSLAQLGIVLAAGGELEKAEARLQEAVAMQERMQLLKHTDYADFLAGLGTVLTKKGDWAAAEEKHQRALELRIEKIGEKNADVVDSLDALAVVAIARGELEAAQQKLIKAEESLRTSESPEHPVIVSVLYHLGWVLAKNGDSTNADRRHMQALEASLRQGPYSRWRLLQGIYDLTDILEKQGKFAEAEPLLLEAAASMTKKSPGDSLTLECDVSKHLARFYEAWDRSSPNTGKSSNAAGWKKRLEELNELPSKKQ